MPAVSSRCPWPISHFKAGRTGGPISAEVSVNAQGAGPGFATHICDVEVDKRTGYVKILRYTTVQDVGRAIHPSYIEGQIQGGVTQGIGWALNEEYIYDKDGRLENPGFLDYRVPVAPDVPMIDTVMVENANPRHPFGARGVGEVPIVPPMAAVANAINDAIGVRMRDLPMSPPRLRAAIDKNGGSPCRTSSSRARPPAGSPAGCPSSMLRQPISAASSLSSSAAIPASAIRSRRGWPWRSTARSTRTPISPRSTPTARSI
jgi:hypothetical protein